MPRDDESRRKELADFLKTRRARAKPSAPAGGPSGRRRTPGLRREEVAEKAGVSVSWYTWLEQGRNVRPSPELLIRLGRVLQLNSFEINHLFDLAGRVLPENFDEDSEEVPPTLRDFVTKLLPAPALVMSEISKILVWNRQFSEQIYDVSKIPKERRTVLDMIFTEAVAQKVRPGWEEDARRTVAEFRWSVGKRLGSPQVKDLVTRLSRESPDFARIWNLRDVQERKKSRLVEILHEKRGKLRFMRSIYVPVECERLRLIVLAPLGAGKKG